MQCLHIMDRSLLTGMGGGGGYDTVKGGGDASEVLPL